jgi:hypothetical protein
VVVAYDWAFHDIPEALGAIAEHVLADPMVMGLITTLAPPWRREMGFVDDDPPEVLGEADLDCPQGGADSRNDQTAIVGYKSRLHVFSRSWLELGEMQVETVNGSTSEKVAGTVFLRRRGVLCPLARQQLGLDTRFVSFLQSISLDESCGWLPALKSRLRRVQRGGNLQSFSADMLFEGEAQSTRTNRAVGYRGRTRRGATEATRPSVMTAEGEGPSSPAGPTTSPAPSTSTAAAAAPAAAGGSGATTAPSHTTPAAAATTAPSHTTPAATTAPSHTTPAAAATTAPSHTTPAAAATTAPSHTTPALAPRAAEMAAKAREMVCTPLEEGRIVWARRFRADSSASELLMQDPPDAGAVKEANVQHELSQRRARAAFSMATARRMVVACLQGLHGQGEEMKARMETIRQSTRASALSLYSVFHDATFDASSIQPVEKQVSWGSKPKRLPIGCRLSTVRRETYVNRASIGYRMPIGCRLSTVRRETYVNRGSIGYRMPIGCRLSTVRRETYVNRGSIGYRMPIGCRLSTVRRETYVNRASIGYRSTASTTCP